MLRVSAVCIHHGEEPPLAGRCGVGNLFFSGCNLRCAYCQNWEISHARLGERRYTPEALAEEMLALEAQGVHHIGLVSPAHQARAVAETLRIAKTRGLRAPVLYNTNAYETVAQLRRFEGLVEIYLPDLKYASDAMAWELSRCRDYTARARAAIQEMYCQVGHLTVGLDGLATRGLLVRLLVLPGRLAGIERSLRFLAEEVSLDLWLSLMAQYEPSYVTASGNAAILERYPELGRRLTRAEYDDALDLAALYGFHRYFTQDPETAPAYGNPAFTRPEPFIWTHLG